MGFHLERRGEISLKKMSLKRHNKKINKSIEGWSSSQWKELNYTTQKFDQLLYQYSRRKA